jgi:hypothetical protein
MMEAILSSETSAEFCWTTQHHIAVSSTLDTQDVLMDHRRLVAGFHVAAVRVRPQAMYDMSWTKCHWGRFSPSTSVSPANSYSTNCTADINHPTIDVIQRRYWLHGVEPFLRGRQLCSYSRTYQYFIEPEGLLPCSQEPSTGPHPELHRSSPYHPILSLEDLS